MPKRTARIAPYVTAFAMVGSVLVAPLVAHGAARRSVQFPEDLAQPTINLSRNGDLGLSEAERVVSAVESTGADAHIVRYGTVGMTRHMRAGRVLERTNGNWRVPLSTVAVPADYVRDLGGADMARVMAAGQLILGRTSAQLRDAQVGDIIVLRDRRFRPHEFEVGAIVNEPFVAWNEVMLSDVAARVLGGIEISSISVTDIVSYSKVVSALNRNGFATGTTWRIRRSWDLQSPDGTLGLASTKKLLGEFAFKPAGGSAIRISPEWLSANIEWKHRFTGIGLRFNCNKAIIDDVQGALDEIVAEGLSRYIDVRNSNRYGGCYVGRYNRLGGNFGSPSRHAWGMAIDINTVTNAQGATPQMNCAVVRIFRKWGFAWGGNFWWSDGMHFEWVGEPRDQLGYPLRYCRNLVDVPTTTLPVFGTTTTTTTTVAPSTTTSSSTTTTSSTSTTTVAPTTTTTLPITSNT